MGKILKVGLSVMLPPAWKVAITEAAEELGVSQAVLLEQWLSASPPALEHHDAVIYRASQPAPRKGARAATGRGRRRAAE